MTYRVVAAAFALYRSQEMRPPFRRLPFPAVACARPAPRNITFTRVWPQYHTDDSFKSFYEYRTGRELTYKWNVLRSHPDDRGRPLFSHPPSIIRETRPWGRASSSA